MIPYIDRDLIRSYLMTFITLLAFVLIGYFVSVILEKSRYLFAGDTAKIGWILMYYISSIPRQIVYAIPFATAVSILWVYTVKARQNELLAYFAGGLSPVRVARPIVILGVVFSIICFVATEFLANPGDQYAAKVERVQIEERSIESLTKEKDVFQKGRGNRFYTIRSFQPETLTMTLPVIIDMGDNWNQPNWRLDAESAQFHTADTAEITSDESEAIEGEWVFNKAVFRRMNEKGEVVEYIEEDSLKESDLDIQIEAELSRYIRQRYKPSRMGVRELLEYIQTFELQSKPTHQLKTYLYFNFALPIGTLVLSLLMCGHILRPGALGLVKGFGGGILLIAAYFIVLVTFRQFSYSGTLPAILVMIVPNAIFLVLGGFLITKYRAM